MPYLSMAITSIYPSQIIKLFALYPASLALFKLYNILRLLNTGVSGEFRYLGWLPSITLPPKAITLPRLSIIGIITLFRKKSCDRLPSGIVKSPSSAISASLTPLEASCAFRPLLLGAKPNLNFVIMESSNPLAYK